MLSLPLLKQSIKSNSVMWGSMTGVMTLLCVQFSMLDMTRSMLFTIFYGMMTTILPGIYVLVTSNKLLASQVDRGSMAYVLATPTKRSTVTFTQAFYLVNSLIAMFGILTLAHLACNAAKPIALGELGFMGLQGDLTSKMIMQVNLSALMVCIALSAICFMFSGIFSSTKYSIGLSGTFVGVSILANMLAMFGKLGVEGLDKFMKLDAAKRQEMGKNGRNWVEKNFDRKRIVKAYIDEISSPNT